MEGLVWHAVSHTLNALIYDFPLGSYSQELACLLLSCQHCSPTNSSLVSSFHSDVEAVAKLITSFLELDRVETPQDFSQSSETEASDADEP